MISNLLTNEKPYWIIVSDEGPASFPYQHETYDSAHTESVRLAKVKPGLKFNIFKYVGHTVAAEPKVTHNTYAEPAPSRAQNCWYPKFVVTRDEIPF